MRLTTTLLSPALAMSVLCQAQTKAIQQQESHVLSVKLGANDFELANTACDRRGNAFVTIWDPAGEQPADRPLLMFDKAGLLKGRFPSSRSDLNLSRYDDHDEPTALLPDGGIARLAWSYNALSLAVFSPDGKLQSRTQLDPPAFFPSHIVVFPSGELLVSGLEHVHSRRAMGPYKSFTAIYDKHGHLRKQLSLAEDAEIDSAAELGDSRYARGPMFGNWAVSGGQIRLGEDGNAYLMRRTTPAIIYVISPSGELLRSLKIEPAESGQMPKDVQISGNRIAIQFSETNITVADSTTGQTLANYSDDEKVQGVLVCYAAKPERFSFLTFTDGHKLRMVEAAVK